MIRHPKVGEVLAYYPILTRREHMPVTIESEPYQLGDGTWIVKARRGDGRRVYPCLEALETIVLPAATAAVDPDDIPFPIDDAKEGATP